MTVVEPPVLSAAPPSAFCLFRCYEEELPNVKWPLFSLSLSVSGTFEIKPRAPSLFWACEMWTQVRFFVPKISQLREIVQN
jgi:hypothetical protein